MIELSYVSYIFVLLLIAKARRVSNLYEDKEDKRPDLTSGHPSLRLRVS
jgi:hypothetical protein